MLQNGSYIRDMVKGLLSLLKTNLESNLLFVISVNMVTEKKRR